MATRTYTFVTGIETSDAPSASAPSATGDILTLGYADTTYARRRDWGFPAANYAALTAIGTTGDNQRYDNQARLVVDTNEVWVFDADSVATPDGTTILQPDSGSGRWLIASAAGGGGGGGGGNAFEQLTQKLELDYQTQFQTEPLDNSAGRAFIGEEFTAPITGSMLDSGASGATGITVVWNARTLNDSSLNIDATTNWTAVNAGATLTASSSAGDFKVGTAGLKFDKNNTATTAGIRYDRGSQNFVVSANTRLFAYVKLPSLTGLSNIYVRVYADTTSNYAQWDLTSNYAGSALVADWNLIFVDLTRTPSSTGGTGWTKNQLSRYFEIGVTASSSAQTYTGICVDSVYFSFYKPELLAPVGQEHTIFNTSTKQSIIFNASNVSADGFMSLAATTPLMAAYNGGLTSTNGFIQRSTLKAINGKTATFDSNFTSGPIGTAQEYRTHSVMRESQSGSFAGFVDYWQPDVFEIQTISGSNVSGTDFGNVSANNLSGDYYNWFRPYPTRENTRYIYLGEKRATANSAYDSTNSFIRLTLADVTGLSGGDFLARDSMVGSLSVVGLNSNENFASISEASAPNGLQLINEAITIPFRENVAAFYSLGGINNTEASKNRLGAAPNLNTVGTPNMANPLNYNAYYLTGVSTSNYYGVGGVSLIDGSGEFVQALCWLWMPAGLATSVQIFKVGNDNGDHGWYLATDASDANFLRLYLRNSGVTSTEQIVRYPKNSWFLVAVGVQSGSAGYLYVNGTKSTLGAGALSVNSANISIGGGATLTTSNTVRYSQMLIYSGAPELSTGLLQNIESNGNFRPYEFGPVLRNKYEATAQSGQKLGFKVTASKNVTTAVGPYIKKLGVIKTS